MTEESSTISRLSVAMTTKTQTTGGNSFTSSSLIGGEVYWQCAVILIGVVGTAGNAFILYALVISKQHKKHMLIVNQNALDLFSSFFLVVTYVVKLCNIHLSGTLGYWLCIVILSENLTFWGTNGSMVNLAIVTIDRYLKVVYPIRSKKWLRRWVIYSAMAFAWFAGIVYNVMIVFYTSAIIDGVCYVYTVFESNMAKTAPTILYISFFYFTILAIFIFCYGRILAAIRHQASVMASHGTSGSSTAQTQSHQIQTNVIKTMILVSAFYAIAWLPYNVYALLVCLMLISTQVFTGSAYYVTMFMGFLYTSANPFIYATKLNPVREILRKMIRCRKSVIQGTNSACPVTRGNQTLK